MATVTPDINVDPNFTRGSGYRTLVEQAYSGRVSEGDRLATTGAAHPVNGGRSFRE